MLYSNLFFQSTFRLSRIQCSLYLLLVQILRVELGILHMSLFLGIPVLGILVVGILVLGMCFLGLRLGVVILTF